MAFAVAKKSDETHLESGVRVLEQESRALVQLAQSLDERFNDAVQLMAIAQGRVVVTGMGKSGHIARKIAATLASTGQPSFFVHPAEAGHGDLGMITQDDVVVALSNSGETTEMHALLSYTRRFKIPLIAITAKPQSTLSQAADVALILPTVPEACPMGLAPTTSTTMMLALGDALAVALLSCRGFSSQDFQKFHPAGNLGHQLKRVSQLMITGDRLPLARPETLMSDVIVEMTAKGKGCIAIVDDHLCLQGVITDGDLRRHMSQDLLNQKAKDIMTQNPKTVTQHMMLAEALNFMNEQRITTLFVANDRGCVEGLIHIHDFLKVGVA